MMSLDVVIPTANNFSSKNFSLYYTIRSILAQSIQPNKIIIVANDNFEETKNHIENEFGKLVTIVNGSLTGQNISYARNLGATYGDSEIIIFMDDDVVIAKNEAFSKILEKMMQEDFYCGADRFWANLNWNDFLDKSYSINHIQHILLAKSCLPKPVNRHSNDVSFSNFSYIGHFGAIRRSIFNSVKGFDEEYQGWAFQDTDLMMRLCLMKARYQLMAYDNISIFHLTHSVDKSKTYERNKLLYVKKQKELGVKFHLNHFFGIFNDDNYSVITKI